MTYTAFDLHKKLTEQEGYDPQSDEYYSEIDKRIRLEFPHKFDTTEPKGKRPNLYRQLLVQSEVQNWSQNCETHTITGSNC